jgi:hypothetical protein
MVKTIYSTTASPKSQNRMMRNGHFFLFFASVTIAHQSRFNNTMAGHRQDTQRIIKRQRKLPV